MIIATYPKEPSAVIQRFVDWDDWLAGRTILTSTWTIPTGITKDDDGILSPAVKTSIILSGGIWGDRYELVNHIVASDGEEQKRSD